MSREQPRIGTDLSDEEPNENAFSQFPIYPIPLTQDDEKLTPVRLQQMLLEMGKDILKYDKEFMGNIAVLVPENRIPISAATDKQFFYEDNVVVPGRYNAGQPLRAQLTHTISVQYHCYPQMPVSQSKKTQHMFALKRSALLQKVTNTLSKHYCLEGRAEVTYMRRYHYLLVAAAHKAAVEMLSDQKLVDAFIAHCNVNTATTITVTIHMVLPVLWAYVVRNKVTLIVTPEQVDKELFNTLRDIIEEQLINSDRKTEVHDARLKEMFCKYQLNTDVEPSISNQREGESRDLSTLQLPAYSHEIAVCSGKRSLEILYAITLRRTRFPLIYSEDVTRGIMVRSGAFAPSFAIARVPPDLTSECVLPFIFPVLKISVELIYLSMILMSNVPSNIPSFSEDALSLQMIIFIGLLALDFIFDMERIVFYFLTRCHGTGYRPLSIAISIAHGLIPFTYLGLSYWWSHLDQNSQMPNLIFSLFCMVVGLTPILEAFNQLTNLMAPVLLYMLYQIKSCCRSQPPATSSSLALYQVLEFIIMNACIALAMILLLNISVNPIYTHGDRLMDTDRNASKIWHIVADSISIGSQTMALLGILAYTIKKLADFKHWDWRAIIGLCALLLITALAASNPWVIFRYNILIAYDANNTGQYNQTLQALSAVNPYAVAGQWLLITLFVVLVARLMMAALLKTSSFSNEHNFFSSPLQFVGPLLRCMEPNKIGVATGEADQETNGHGSRVVSDQAGSSAQATPGMSNGGVGATNSSRYTERGNAPPIPKPRDEWQNTNPGNPDHTTPLMSGAEKKEDYTPFKML